MEDASVFLSLAPRVDVFLPPLKRARVNAPFVLRDWANLAASPTKDSPRSSSSIHDLKDECLLAILKRLDGDSDRSAAACVSKRWLTLLATTTSPKPESPKKLLPDLNETANPLDDIDEGEDDQTIISSRCLEGNEATDVSLLAMAIGSGGRGGIGKLSIRSNGGNSGRLSDLGLRAIAVQSPNLKALSIWNARFITDKGLSQIAIHCPLLEKLDLSGCPLVSDKGISAVASKCRRLTSLAIESCPNVGDDCLWAVGHFCSNLSSISISDSKLVGDKGIASLLSSSSSSSSSLRRVTFRRLGLTDLSLAIVGHYGKAISELVLAELPSVTERGLWVMACARGLKNLSSLTLICCGATDLGLEAVARGCPSLKKLSIQNCPLLSDSGLLKLAASSPLEALQLEDCNLITLPGVIGSLLALSERLRSFSIARCSAFKDVHSYPPTCASSALRSLIVRQCPGFGDSGLLFLGKICKNLRRVQLTSLPGISDAGLLPFFRDGCRAGLIKVKLGGCEGVADAAIAALAKGHGRTLRALQVSGCNRVTDRGAAAVAESCFRLEDLDFSGSSITDAGVAAVAGSNGNSLRILSLGGCEAISGKSLVDLGNRCGSLAGLNLQLCDSITGDDVVAFQSRMGRCDVLF